MNNYLSIDINGYIVGKLASQLPKDPSQLNLIEYDELDHTNDMWDYDNLEWKADDRPLPDVQHLIKKIDFYDLFTDAELILISDSAKTSGAVDVYLKKIEALDTINLNNPKLQSGLLGLESAGILASGRASGIYETVNSDVTINQPARI